MALDDLVVCIKLLQERMRSHNAALRENETRTRMALIDPLLHALGWDVSDPGVVTPEYKVSGGWADYALLRPEGQPAATVEAKKLGEALVPHRMQMLNYANASGIDYAGLTDGNHWELYDVFKRGQLEERRILEVSIARTPAHESALKLLDALARQLGVPSAGSSQPADSWRSFNTNARSAPRRWKAACATTGITGLDCVIPIYSTKRGTMSGGYQILGREQKDTKPLE